MGMDVCVCVCVRASRRIVLKWAQQLCTCGTGLEDGWAAVRGVVFPKRSTENQCA